jgi:putative transposase
MQVQFESLTDAQITILAELVPVRKRKHDIFLIIEGIFWIVRTGAQWRNIDSKYGDYRVVYYYFNSWSKKGLFLKMNAKLVELERARVKKAATPTVASVDSQSIKIAPFTSKEKGIDGGKRVNGRKRHIITDVNGLILRVLVGAANEHDGKGGIRLFMKDENFFSQIKHFFVDHAYGGKFRELIEKYGSKIELAAKPEGTKGFIPLAIRWTVERTFGWLNFFRRLSKDYEKNVENSESMIYLAQIQILLNRLT